MDVFIFTTFAAMKNKIIAFTFFLHLLYLKNVAQLTYDSSLTFPYFQFHASFQIPYGDLSKRFGNNMSVGGSTIYKLKSNYLFAIDGNYFFSKNVKEDVMSQLKTSTPSGESFVIDNEGFPADLRITERGWNLTLNFGKIFYIGGNNKNRGIHYQIGLGYLQHKIKLYDAQQKIAAIKGDRIKGYDRLSIGGCVYNYLGYTYLSSNRFVNFTIGLEFYYAITQNVRYYDYATASIDTKIRHDMLAGIKFGWILPVYRKADGIFFYD
ncbi:MAG: hypothetical protein KatS3mg027_0623 [Bacteroidia bacterium]|nr:MAG: hypothetical protein KatS3mg027_0623 [Bacteroidia bacterium]